MTTLQTDSPTTAERLHAEAVDTYRRLVVAEYNGETVDANELRECLIILGLRATALTQDVETLRRRERAFDAIVEAADSRQFTNLSSTAQHTAIEQHKDHLRYVEDEFQRIQTARSQVGGPTYAPVSFQRMGPIQSELNPIDVAVRDLLATGDEFAANHVRGLIAELRGAQHKRDEAEWLAGGTAWARDEIEHLDQQRERLAVIVAEGDRLLATLPGYLPAINAAKETLVAMEREVVVDGATLSPMKNH